MEKKRYKAPIIAIGQLNTGELMKISSPSPIPMLGAPARHLGGTKSEVF